MAKNFAEMTFTDFANVMRPSGAVNRVTLPGTDTDLISYSAYMNGPLAKDLPKEAQEYQYKDVMVNALTEKLGLDPSSFRDNLKIAEIVATRGAWMAAVCESAKDWSLPLTPEVMDDYNLLANSMTAMEHPWIVAEVEKQVALSMGLTPVLMAASQAMGGVSVRDRAPGEVATGRVVSQNLDFTVQQTKSGEVVTHENRRLLALPPLGEDTSVTYYRGNGQVVASLENMKVSAPFIDEASMDIAVMVNDGKDKEQKILFNSMSGFREFVRAHSLDHTLIPIAMAVREALPKMDVIEVLPVRELVGAPYIEEESRCLAIDYKENGMKHSALFGSLQAMQGCAKEYGLSANLLAHAAKLESGRGVTVGDLAESKAELGLKLRQLGVNSASGAVDGKTYAGKIIAETNLHVAQDIGRGEVVVHDLRDLDKVVSKGERMTAKYQNGRGQVAEVERDGAGLSR